MTSLLLDSTHGRKTSGVACHHRLRKAHTIRRRRAWHAIIAFWAAQMVERRRASHDITTLGLHTQSDDVGHGMTSPLLENTHSRTTSGVAWHHHSWTTHIVGRRRAWHDITALGQHTQSDDVGRGMTSQPLDSTHGQQCRAWHDITALGQHTQSDDVGRGMKSPPLDSTHSRTTSGMA